MATTTNFGWTTPDDTDLVKDGAAAIRTLGQSIDTSMMDLEGGTTGQILAKNSNTDMDFVWTTPNPGDITGVTAGVGISGGGTSGAVTVTNSMATAIDAKGDLVAGTGADTFDRLAVGTDGQVLTASAAAATGLSWATPASGSMTLLSTTTISTMLTSITGISGSYKHLMINIFIVNVASNSPLYLDWGTTSGYGNSYMAYQTSVRSGTTSVTYSNSVATSGFDMCGGNTMDGGSSNNVMYVYIPFYTVTSTVKPVDVLSSLTISAVRQTGRSLVADFGSNTRGVIDRFAIDFQTGASWSGTIEIYGVN